jgi:putative MATE family efflux protein
MLLPLFISKRYFVKNPNDDNTTMQVRNLTEGSIVRQLFTLAMPLMAVSFIQMSYNLIDLAWIGRLGSRSVAAVGTVGLLMWMMHSVALTSKVGAEISIGQSIGSRRLDKASIYASHTTTIAIILGLFFGILFSLFPDVFVSFFDLENDISREAINYLRIVALTFPLMFLILNFSGIYIGSGRSDIPFYFNSAGLILNIILSPLFIFGWIGFPKLGTQGAALATVIAQLIVVLLFIWHLKRYGLLGKFSFFVKPKASYTRNILKLGVPIATMNVFFSFINMNLVRIAFHHGGHLGVTSQTTGGQIEGISWNTSLGFATALGTFVAQNFAAKRMDRVKRAFRYAMSIMTVFGVLVSSSFILFGDVIFSVFIPEEEAIKAGGDYLFVLGVSQLFMMIELTTEGMFHGLGRTTPPAIISMSFNLIRIPLAMLLASQMGITGVWWAISITSIFKGIILFIWYLVLQRKLSEL